MILTRLVLVGILSQRENGNQGSTYKAEVIASLTFPNKRGLTPLPSTIMKTIRMRMVFLFYINTIGRSMSYRWGEVDESGS